MTGQVCWGSLWRDHFCWTPGPAWWAGRARPRCWWRPCWGAPPARAVPGPGQGGGPADAIELLQLPAVVPWLLRPPGGAAASPWPGPPATAGWRSRRRPSPWRPAPAASLPGSGQPRGRVSGSVLEVWKGSTLLASSPLWWGDGGKSPLRPLLRPLQTCSILSLLLSGLQVLKYNLSYKSVDWCWYLSVPLLKIVSPIINSHIIDLNCVLQNIHFISILIQFVAAEWSSHTLSILTSQSCEGGGRTLKMSSLSGEMKCIFNIIVWI